MNGQIDFRIDPDSKWYKLGISLLPLVLLIVIVGGLFLFTVRFGQVTGEQVGIRLNKIDGSSVVINESGKHFYNGFTHSFYTLDKTLQTLEMTAARSRGDRKGVDDLKIKTVDGSDVNIDMKIQYSIDPYKADAVIADSGLGDAYKEKWARDYSRAICRNSLGKLTTEDFYDSGKRDKQISDAKDDINEKLEAFGITIDAVVIPTRPRFYADYEEMIKRKKYADQGVEQEISKALAAQEKQATLLVEEENRKRVAIEAFAGEMEAKIIAVKAEGEKISREADAYYNKKTIGAEATLYEMKKQAEAILAMKSAEAKGIEAMKQALEGEGGRNMVKLEYAKRLKNVQIEGKPYIINGQTGRFEHSYAPTVNGKPASSGGK